MSEPNDIQQRMAERLSETMRRRGLSQTELASRVDTSKQQIYKLEKGIVRLRDEWARKIAPHLGVSPEWLLFLTDSDEAGDEVPAVVLSPSLPVYVPISTLEVRAGAGGGGIIDGAFLGSPRFFERDFVTRELRASPENLVVVEVEGQSMEPLLRSGDTVMVDRRKQNVAMEGVFVLFDGEGIVCKWVERVHDTDVPKLRIVSENERFKPYEVEADRCQILGRVVWFARRL